MVVDQEAGLFVISSRPARAPALRGGKVVERWDQNDAIGLMTQLGAIQPPGGGTG